VVYVDACPYPATLAIDQIIDETESSEAKHHHNIDRYRVYPDDRQRCFLHFRNRSSIVTYPSCDIASFLDGDSHTHDSESKTIGASFQKM